MNHFIDKSDIARNLADSIREIERELYQAHKTAFDLERQRDAANDRARNFEFTSYVLSCIVLGLAVVLVGYL